MVREAYEQLQTLPHVTGIATPWRDELIQAIAKRAPFPHAKAWLSTTGSRAIEIAWKIATMRRPGAIVSFDQGFHGKSIAVSCLSATPRVPFLNEALSSLVHAEQPYPFCGECPWGRVPSTCSIECADAMECWLDQYAEKVSAIVIEPWAGARGYLRARHEFYQRLRAKTSQLGIALIADEIQTGLGRLGTMWACEGQGWIPDLLVIGKSLGGGLLPISAVLGPASWIDLLDPGIESETFASDPVGCRIGLKVLEWLTPQFFAEASQKGEQLRQSLQQMLERQKLLSRVHLEGEGCVAILHCNAFDSPAHQASDPSIFALQFAQCALHEGVLVHRTGPRGNRIVILPSLLVTSDEIQEGVASLERALARVHQSLD